MLLAESEDDEELIPFVLEDYFDNLIILARMRVGITQYKLAKLLDVSQSYGLECPKAQIALHFYNGRCHIIRQVFY